MPEVDTTNPFELVKLANQYRRELHESLALKKKMCLPTGNAKMNKRQPTVPIPLRLLAHLRRWHRIDSEAKHFVEFNGKPVSSVKTAFKSAVRLAGLGAGISPHTLRHTAATC
jgi:integrase